VNDLKILGLDCGATEIKGVVTNERGIILDTACFPSNLNKGIKGYLSSIQLTIKQLYMKNMDIALAGIASAGRINTQNALVEYATDNIPNYTGTNLRDVAGEVIQVPVYAENDARAALMGEYWLGAAKDLNNVVMLTLGTGLGGANLVDGRIYSGHGFKAGEWGHVIIEQAGRQCTCGRKGCLEQYVSSGAVTLAASKAVGRSIMREEIFSLYKEGNREINRVIEEFVGYLALAIYNISVSLDPEAVIIGGGLSEYFDDFISPLRNELEKYRVNMDIRKAVLLNRAGCVGAAKLAIDNLM